MGKEDRHTDHDERIARIYELLGRARAEDETAKEELMRMLDPLVRRRVTRLAAQLGSAERDELFQWVQVDAWDLIQAYDPKKCDKLLPYLKAQLSTRVRHHVREEGRYRGRYRALTDLEDPAAEDPGSGTEALLADPQSGEPFGIVTLRVFYAAEVSRLPERLGLVMRLLQRGWDQKRIAAHLGVTQQRVSQIIRAAQAGLLREWLREDFAGC